MRNPVSVRIEEDVAKKLEEYCKKESRSISNVINYILKIFFKLIPDPKIETKK